MPIHEADPWRLQYFDGVDCPAHVHVPTEDSDAWSWNPRHRWVYDKLAVALSQGLRAAPHGVAPETYPVFSKPIVNLRGMGVDSRPIGSADEYRTGLTAGHFWTELLEGEHVSTDAALVDGAPLWWRHATGVAGPGGTFDHWVVHAASRPGLEAYCGDWSRRLLRGYTGMVNFETIGGRIIEVHLRFADQWPDLYGPGWVEALVGLYESGTWRFADDDRATGYSVVLFAPHGGRPRHPAAGVLEAVRGRPGISSAQITFHEDRDPAAHAMPPGGFRLAIVNCRDLRAGVEARSILAAALEAGRAAT